MTNIEQAIAKINEAVGKLINTYQYKPVSDELATMPTTWLLSGLHKDEALTQLDASSKLLAEARSFID